MSCDDGTIPADSALAESGPLMVSCAEGYGKPLDVWETPRGSIEAAGFVNVDEKFYKAPMGSWPRQPVYRDAGRLDLDYFKGEMEGWVMCLLTKVRFFRLHPPQMC